MTDKNTKRIIINPFKNLDEFVFVRRVSETPQGYFLTEHPYKASLYVESATWEFKKDNKTYIVAEYRIDYTENKLLIKANGTNDGNSFRYSDILLIGPEEGCFIGFTNIFKEALVATAGKHAKEANNSYVLVPGVSLELYDQDTSNKSFMRDANKTKVNYRLIKDLDNMPTTIFLKERDTFTMKFTMSKEYNTKRGVNSRELNLYTRLHYLSYQDVGLTKRYHERPGVKGQKLVGTNDANDYFHGKGNNTYVFHYNWRDDIINAEGSDHKLEFYGNTPETFKVTKQGTDLKIQRDNSGNDTITITRFHPENFSFYKITSSIFHSDTKQKYTLTANDAGQYKLALANK